MNKITLIFITSIILFSCKSKNPDLTCERINYLIGVKSEVAKKYWNDFKRNTLFGPMLYYTKGGLFTINANEKLKNRIDIKPYNCNFSEVEVGYTKLIDTTEFHMNVSYHQTDTIALYYKNTLGMFSDVDLTKKFIPDVKDTDEWMSMVIHEMFHQYQRSFSEFREKQVSSKQYFTKDTLNYFFRNENWFKESVKKENRLLLDILELNSNDSIRKYISNYLTTKTKRISKINNDFGLEILDLENSLSKSEGTARYIEYCVKLTLKEILANNILSEIDDNYKAKRFENYSLKQDDWMYNVGGAYYYSIGFNLTRVLEKLKIDYQRDVFSKNKPFDVYLNEYIK